MANGGCAVKRIRINYANSSPVFGGGVPKGRRGLALSGSWILIFILLLSNSTYVLAQDPTPTAPPPANDAEARLHAIPLIPDAFSERVFEIYAAGQELGNNANVFAKAGDSNSNSKRFLYEIDQSNYDLGPYTDLQETVDFFAGSFGRQSQATNGGFNLFALQDGFLANPEFCDLGESPLECELRLNQPSLLFFTHGSNDLQDLGEERFEELLRSLVETCIERGTVPVLTNYTLRDGHELWDKLIAFNNISADIAEEYEIPFINLWLGTLSLPDNGISEDTIHLTFGSQAVRFGGAETQWGHDLRNLLTLQILDRFRQQVVLGEVAE